MFVDPSQKVPVTIDEENIIYVRAKMDMAVDAAVTVAFATINQDAPVKLDKAYQLALLQHNILDWEGPDFLFTPKDSKGVELPPRLRPCNVRTIGQLDPGEPLVWAAIIKINELNRTPEGKDPPKKKPEGKKGKKKKSRADKST